jgi:hypothetical protein
MFSNLFPKIVSFVRYVEKYWGDGQSTDDINKTAHALCLLDK